MSFPHTRGPLQSGNLLTKYNDDLYSFLISVFVSLFHLLCLHFYCSILWTLHLLQDGILGSSGYETTYAPPPLMWTQKPEPSTLPWFTPSLPPRPALIYPFPSPWVWHQQIPDSATFQIKYHRVSTWWKHKQQKWTSQYQTCGNATNNVSGLGPCRHKWSSTTEVLGCVLHNS